jgi:flagellar biosynthetic protein FliR
MLELTDLITRHLDSFLLAFFRVGAMLAVAPVLGHRSVPVPHRAGLAGLFALVLAPLLARPAGGIAQDMLGLTLAVAGEVFVGLTIGFVATLVLAGVEIAGELIGLQMGLGLGAIFDPAMGQNGTVLGRFQSTLALLLFLTVNGHHLLIRAVAASFQRIGPGGILDATVAGGVASLGGKMVRSGLDLAAPLVGILLVVNVALALLGRVAPQSNIFMIGLPLSLGMGLVGLVDALPTFGRQLTRLIAEIPADLNTVFAGALHGLR